MNGDDEGTGGGQALALISFCAGGVVLLFEWHHWKQLPLLFFFFLFAIAVGAVLVRDHRSCRTRFKYGSLPMPHVAPCRFEMYASPVSMGSCLDPLDRAI
jgi:hypothetical protein